VSETEDPALGGAAGGVLSAAVARVERRVLPLLVVMFIAN
jgi:hypothetical protein